MATALTTLPTRRVVVARFRVPAWWVAPAIHSAEPTKLNVDLWTWGVYSRDCHNSNGLVASGLSSRSAAQSHMRKLKAAARSAQKASA